MDNYCVMDWYSYYAIHWRSEKESIKEVIIEDGVTNIDNSAFYRCSALTSVTIPDSVTNIDWDAFKECTNLESITILNSECEIYNDNTTIYAKTEIKGYTNSTAQAYSEKYNHTFIVLDKESEPEYTLGNLIDADDATLVLSYYAEVSTGSTQSFEDFLKK